jgi:hypothetical protein
MPVDRVARAVLELSGLNGYVSSNPTVASDDPIVYHVQNTRTFHWTHDLLPTLRSAGLNFDVVPQQQWIKRLREGEQDPVKNPTIKLLDFFTEKYDNDKPGRAGLVFAMDESSKQSATIKEGFDVLRTGLMEKIILQWGLVKT